MKRKLSNEQEQQIIERYQAGETPQAIAPDYGLHQATVVKILKRNGIKTRSSKESHLSILSDAQVQEIVSRYQSGESSTSIARDYENVSDSLICHLLKRNKVRMRLASETRRYSLNEHVFDILTESAAYWVGFLMADGCIIESGNSYRIQLALQRQDVAHITAFQQFVGTSNKVTFNQNAAKISLSSTQLAQKLSEYGVVPRKSLIAVASPSVAYNRHFWRGVFDGDGSIGTYWNKSNGRSSVSIGLAGSARIVAQFKDFLESEGIRSKASIRPCQNIYQYRLSNWPAVAAAQILYTDSTIYLPRKYQKYIEALEIQQTSLRLDKKTERL